MTNTDDDYTARFMREYACTVIPAREGWSVGLIVENADTPEWTEVIAWKVFVRKENPDQHFVEPVTPNGAEACSNEKVLRHPDGSIEQVEVQRWDDWNAFAKARLIGG